MILALVAIAAIFWLYKINFFMTDAPSETSQSSNPEANSSDFVSALDRASERVTKKPFGIYITLENSPVQPERFTGYHTGVDFEIFPGEENTEVSVKAVCAGKLIYRNYISGYGGVAGESCELNGQLIIVIYGHLKLDSIINKIIDELKAGEKIGILGKSKSTETDSERKHLHLGFIKGEVMNLKGYVAIQAGLSDWIDPCEYVCGK